jgi:hypothetical protein
VVQRYDVTDLQRNDVDRSHCHGLETHAERQGHLVQRTLQLVGELGLGCHVPVGEHRVVRAHLEHRMEHREQDTDRPMPRVSPILISNDITTTMSDGA